MNPNRKKVIKLNSYGTRVRDLRKFTTELFDAMGDEIFEPKDWNTFLYTTLKYIYPANKNLENNINSITKSANIVVSHFFERKTTAKLFKITDNGTEEIKIKQKKILDYYTQDIIHTDKVPRFIYQHLEENVKRDLIKINELISKYEIDPYIEKLISKNLQPSNHEQSIKHDFYKRCINEQKTILKYYLTGLKKRTIQRSGYIWPSMRSLFEIGQTQRDFPYKFHFEPEFFDHTLIKKARHRVGNFLIDESFKMEALYEKDKDSFYRKYFKLNKPDQIFTSINFHFSHLPLKSGRRVIFDELHKLHKGKKWMAFFALALPQVEGLFTEMFDAIYSGQNGRSLSDKVEKVRPYHYLSQHYFDYYQYIVPSIRNRFMHTGYAENFKINAYDLLTDIEHLLRIFYELDNPLVKVNKTIISRKQEEFISYKEFAVYFTLLNNLHPDQKKTLDEKLNQFEKEFLHDYCNTNFICEEFITQLPHIIQELTIKIEYSVSSAAFANALSYLPFNEIKKKVIEQNLIERLKDAFRFNPDELQNVLSSGDFLAGYKKYLPSVNKDIIQELDRTKKEKGKFSSNISQLKKFLDENHNDIEE